MIQHQESTSNAVPFGLDWALYAARCGYAVFPIRPGNKEPYSREATARALGIDPAAPAGVHHARSDEASIRALWTGDRANAWIGLAMGSGRMAIDSDEKNGKSGLATMAANGWTVPVTAWQRTPSGGAHFIVVVPPDTFAPTDQGALGDGLDRRGHGGYIVLYDSALLTTAPAPAPAWSLINARVPGEHRSPLGTDQAPSFDLASKALWATDPNEFTYEQWRNVTAAYRQAATGTADDDAIRINWDGWCVSYRKNDAAANNKLWRSLNNGTGLGWSFLRDHAVRHGDLSDNDRARLIGLIGAVHHLPTNTTAAPSFGDILTADEQRLWFAGCTLIGPENRIIDAKGQQFDVGAFNSTFGGKRFIIDRTGKTTDEAWKAATRSTLWTVPKVDGTSFRPDLATGTIATDELGRRSVNIYIPATIERMEGDPSPFLNHLAALIPNPDDQRILISFMAHNAQYPGFKIPWAPVIQSTEGAGKNIIKYAMSHVMGDHYTYPPNPKELAAGGGKFNDWMNRKLFLIADEIKTDDKRDLVEVLKPMISETTLEMQGKGRDQRKADNPANWLFFTNWKDAIPVHVNGRRFAIFYSALQSLQDALDSGMNDAYFKALYDDWLGARTHKTGLKIVADYLLRYPIQRGAIPMRAPHTSSMAEAILECRGWLETIIADAVEDQRNGFRAGWISTAAVASLLREQRRDAKARTVGDALKVLGYHRIGQAGRGYFLDDPVYPNRRGWLWNIDPLAIVANYGRAQNYE